MSELQVTSLSVNNTINTISISVGSGSINVAGVTLNELDSLNYYAFDRAVLPSTFITGLDITYGNGAFYSCGYNGRIGKSTDGGVTWTAVNTEGNNLRGIAYGDGVVVAVGAGGNAYYSTNEGVTWSNALSANATTTMRGITYGNGYFVAVGFSGVIQTSTDGVTWSQQIVGGSTIQDVAYGNGKFVAVRSANSVLVSEGTPLSFSATGNLLAGTSSPVYYGIDYLPETDTFFAVGTNNYIMSTTSSLVSTSWSTAYSEETSQELYKVGCGNSTVIAAGLGANVLISIDGGTTFNHKSIASDSADIQIEAVKYGDGVFSLGREDTNRFYYTPRYETNLNFEAIRVGNTQLTANMETSTITVGGKTFTNLYETVNTQIFTANGTWTKPVWATDGKELVVVHMWGGGGGGTSNASFGVGGGGGAFVFGYYVSSQLGSTANVVVGSGGSAAINGNDGENSSFADATNNTLTAFGGGGGYRTIAASGAGGGWQAAPAAGVGGGPLGGAVGTTGGTSTFGGGGGVNGSPYNGGDSIYGGGGGSASGQGVAGSSIFGGGGGAGATGGSSVYGGAGGKGAVGSIPGGGGGYNFAGARGEIRVYTYRIIS